MAQRNAETQRIDVESKRSCLQGRTKKARSKQPEESSRQIPQIAVLAVEC